MELNTTYWHMVNKHTPPKDTVLLTKIHNEGEDARNVQKMIFDGRMWWTSDKEIYVYYKPTHWAFTN